MFLKCGDAPPLLGHSEVPPRVTESYILSGYRFPNYSLRQCLLSAFRPTNETGNFWTHFLPVFVFAWHFAEVFGWEGAPPAGHAFFYPLWTYFLGVLLLLAASSLAHLLNSMSLVVREVCFFVDYGTISAYTVGSSLAYYYYIHPRAGLPGAGLRGPEAGLPAAASNGSRGDQVLGAAPLGYPALAEQLFESLYVPSSCAVAVICILSCCNTRQRWRRHRYLIRTLVFLLPFLVSSTPIFYRLLTRSPYPPASASFASSVPMAVYFYRHCGWLVASAVFNIAKLPERLAPGRFDVWGHSHQWFHCCTFLSILDELHMIKAEVRAALLQPALALAQTAAAARLPGPTAPSTYGVMLLVQAAIAAIIGWFSWQAERIHGPERDRLVRSGQKGHKCH